MAATDRIRATVRRVAPELAKLAHTYGPGFLAYAVAANLLDEVIIPGGLALLGHPVLGGIALAGDLDWLTYPLYFGAVALWRMLR